ncbi:phosphoribosylaminoimidazole carboxylase catalytic subunit [Salmonella enterica subsp. enterica serovar Thompson]|nr:phosphoribosylaminoimidazole carboxylase catalytic subunit [Salmonella enterica subsp. enterica serovar Thompson]
MSSRNNPARVAIVMGSKSDWATMQFAAEIFEILDVPHHVEVVSAIAPPISCSASPKRRKRTDIK